MACAGMKRESLFTGMTMRFRQHLRLRLLLWIVAIPAPPLLLTLWFAQQNYADLVDRMQRSAEQLAGQTAATLSRILFERERDAQLLSALPAVRSLDQPRMTVILNQTVTAYAPHYRLIVVAGQDGSILAVNDVDGSGRPLRSRALLGQSLTTKDWFAQELVRASRSHGPTPVRLESLGPDPLVEQVYGEDLPLVRVTAPIHSERGTLQGVWVAWVDGAVLLDALRDSSHGLNDQSGLLVGLYDRDELALGFSTQGRPPSFGRPLVERPLGAPFGWTLRVYPAADAASPRAPLTLPMVLVVLGSIAGGAVLLGWLTTRQILDPLERLAKQAEAFRGGPSRFTVDAGRTDAIGAIQQALASMAVEVEATSQSLAHEASERRKSEREAQTLAERNRRLAEVGIVLMKELSLDDLLRTIVEQGCALFGARYGALGIIGGDGRLTRFIPVGMDEATMQQIGALPTGKGLLGAPLSAGVLRVEHMMEHPQAGGFPPHHPVMNTLLAVSIQSRNRQIGRLYFTEKEGGAFSEADELIVGTLAALAAAAIENATLFETTQIQQGLLEAEEREARNARAGLDTLLAQAPDLIIFTQPDGTIVRFNRGAEQMLGYAEAEMLGHPAARLYADAEDRRALVAEVEARGEVVGREVQLKAKDGHLVDLSLTLVPFKDHAGQAIGLVGFGKDVTELKRMERALKASNQELEHFTFSISHDLQTPLRGIHGFADILLRRAKDKLNEKEVHYLTRMQVGAERMAALINDLLELSRIGRVTYPFEACAMEELLDQACGELESVIRATQAQVQAERPLPVVAVDRIRMQRVWVNLLSNAIKYVAPGTMPVVTVGTTGRRMRDGRAEWVFFVRDNGIGIAPEYHQQIFEVFRRLHTHEQYEGTGAGLAIVKRIVEFHQGRVWVESREGGGSTFWFTLPQAPAAAPQAG